jgi:hypothetical protein
MRNRLELLAGQTHTIEKTMNHKHLIKLAALLSTAFITVDAHATDKKPNVVYFLVDNLGMGELSSYGGGPLRGVYTTRIDAFAKEGMMLLSVKFTLAEQ